MEGHTNERRYWIKVEERFMEAQDNPKRLLEFATRNVTETGVNNVLHMAAVSGELQILRSILDKIKDSSGPNQCKDALSAQNEGGNTPLHYAATRGNLDICKCIMSDDLFHPLVHSRNKLGETPLFLAALHGHKETFLWLHEASIISPTLPGAIPSWKRNNGDTILHCTISREHFDFALEIFRLYKEQKVGKAANEKGLTPLHLLASKPRAFRSGIRLRLQQFESYDGRSILLKLRDFTPGELEEEKYERTHQVMRKLVEDYYGEHFCEVDEGQKEEALTPLLLASKSGVIEMVRKILNTAPMTIHETTKKNENILLVAVENRQISIIEELMKHESWDYMKETVDDNGNNVLHLAAHLPEGTYQGISPALQLDLEVTRYKYLIRNVPNYLIFQTNNEGKTPNQIFMEDHEKIASEVSELLNRISDSFSVVAVLVAGALFAICTNVPGGIDQTGKPTYLGDSKFKSVSLASMTGLCCSVTSLFSFIAMRTTLIKTMDYQMRWPITLIIGSWSLQVALVCLMTSFIQSLLMILQGGMRNTFYIIISFSLPIPCYLAVVPQVLDFALAFNLSKHRE